MAGTRGANVVAESADLVINIGTRLTDFTTVLEDGVPEPGRALRQHQRVRAGRATSTPPCPLIGDAKASLEELGDILGGYQTGADYQEEIARHNHEWNDEVERLYTLGATPISQGEIIGAVEASADPHDVVVTSAGSLPGDLLKLWRSREASSYQVEYGFSCMGYEIAGGIGAKLAAPEREVYVMVGDASFLMMSSRDRDGGPGVGSRSSSSSIDNSGFSSVGRVSEQVGSEGFGCHYRARGDSGLYDGETLQVDFAALCRGYGAQAVDAETREDLAEALQQARAADGPSCHRAPHRLARARARLRLVLVGHGDGRGRGDPRGPRCPRRVRAREGA